MCSFLRALHDCQHTDSVNKIILKIHLRMISRIYWNMRNSSNIRNDYAAVALKNDNPKTT